jgi:hypothetical protein
VDARVRWQALQSRLTAAQTLFEQGDRERALAEVDAALAIDPSFLAAGALRERILGSGVPGSGVPGSGVSGSGVPGSGVPGSGVSGSGVPGSGVPNPKNPEPGTRNPEPFSRAGYAKFEQRARRRRVDRKIDVATQAMARGNLRAAAAALDEVIELDPNLPELSSLTAAFDDLRRSRAETHRGPMIAAAIAFSALVFSASWLQEGRVLLSHPVAVVAGLVEARRPEPLAAPVVDTPLGAEPLVAIATTGQHDDAAPEPIDAPRPTRPASVPAAFAVEPVPPAPLPVTTAPAPAAFDVPRAAPPPPSPPLSLSDSDEAQITRALQQYRSAYDRLDAEQAQTLTFDTCHTQVRGDEAVATCEGSTRYVPKIGSREPRVEARTWSFALRRAGDAWKIETARVER